MDKRSNPRISNQNWVELKYIDNESMQRKLRNFVKGKFSVYLFCGQENYCTLNVDADPRSKANLVMEGFQFLESLKDNSVDVFIFDPLFVFISDEKFHSNAPTRIKDGFYNANKKHWENAMREYGLPEEVIYQAMKSDLFGHNMELQRTIYKKLKPGGVAISKRGMANCNTMSKVPELYYVHDSRPSAHIVRFDWKESDEDEQDLNGRTRI